MIKGALAVTLLFLSTTAKANDTGNDLYAHCMDQRNAVEFGMCMGAVSAYFEGVLVFYKCSEEHDNVTRKQLIDVVVEVGALVGAADHGDHQVGVLPDLLVADRRFRQMLVFVDPFREAESLQASPHRRSPRAVIESFASLPPWAPP